MNATIIRGQFIAVSETQIKIVSSPSEGETIRFTFKVPSGSNEDSVFICSTRAISLINDCDRVPLPPGGKGGGPVRVEVNFTYP